VARAAGILVHSRITAVLADPGYGEQLTVVAFNGATGIGPSAIASGRRGAPSVTLTTTAPQSWVFAVGNDWDRSIRRVLGPAQTLISESTDSVGDTYWVQDSADPTPASATVVTINDTAPTRDRWNLAAVAIQ
jgi:hypothetical protein